METTRASGKGRRRRRFLMFVTAVLAMASVGATAYTLALFTSSDVNGANTFTTGTIVIGVSPASTLLTASNMMPGDVANGR